MFDKVNVFRIIVDHVSTLKDYKTGNYVIGDFILLFVVPLLPAFFLLYSEKQLNFNLISLFTILLSVCTVFLSNLALLIYKISQNTEKRDSYSALEISFLKEVWFNISFCILIAVLTITVLIFTGILGNHSKSFVLLIFNFVDYYLVVLFFIALLIILKRVHVLLRKGFEE